LFPLNQNLDYDYPIYRSFFNPEVLISCISLLLVFGAGGFLFYLYGRPKPHIRLFSFGIFWFFINLLLESSIIPLNNVISEHRVYLPSVGIFLALVTLLFLFNERVETKSKGAGMILICVLFLIISLSTFRRNAVWKDEVTVWEDTARKSPNKKRPRDSLGLAYNSQGLYNKAITQFKASIKFDPYDAFQSVGNIEKAIAEYQIAIKLKPDPDVYYNLGHAYHSLNLISKAIEQYKIVLKLEPNYGKAHYNLGMAYKTQGLIEKAKEHFRIARKLNPDL
jgi:tetratricopeptide (TPR) repeat protein